MAVLPFRPRSASRSLLQLRASASTAAAAAEAAEASQNESQKRKSQQQELIETLCEEGKLDRALDILSRMGTVPSDKVYLSLLKACNKTKALTQVKRVHAHLAQHKADLSCSLGDYLVMTLAKCGAIEDACQIFSRLACRTVFSWTAIISAYVDCGRGQEALKIYQHMQDDGVQPDSYTFVSLFKACGSIPDLRQGKKLHAEAGRQGTASDVFVGNTLMSMYGKCGAIVDAEDVFHGMFKRNIVSWSAMLSAYVEQGQGEKALQLYRQMQEEGVSPDQRTFVFALQACGMLAEKEEACVVQGRLVKLMSLEIGQALHAVARSKGFSSDVFVGTALLSMYSKCEAIVEAEDVFCALPQPNIVSWNAMLTAYVDQDLGEKALQSYKQMLKECMTLDDVTFMCILQACSETGFLEICKHLHFDIISAGHDRILSMAATLIHAYGSSASMIDAQAVFDELPQPHIASWNACIAGHAGEGNSIASLHMFEKMKWASAKPDEVTFVLVLSACSHSGLLVQGLEYFESMSRDYSLTPDLRHYGIMINLLGRAGDFRGVESMLDRMPVQANPTIWLCLLGACRTHGNLELAKQAFAQAVSLQPKHATPYVLMSNIYANAGLQKCAAEVEKFRKKRCGEVACLELDEG